MFSKKKEKPTPKNGKKRATAAERRRMGADESREMILEAAFELFSVKGFHGTSIRNIARTAGVSEGLIYHHFENKLDLLNAIFQTFAIPDPHLVADKLLVRLNNPSLEELIGELFRYIMEGMEKGRMIAFFKILLNSMDSLDVEEKRKLACVIHDRLWDRLSSVLFEHFPENAKESVDPYVFFRIIQGSFMGYVFFQELFEWKHFVELDRDLYVRTAARLLSNGLACEGGSEKTKKGSRVRTASKKRAPRRAGEVEG